MNFSILRLNTLASDAAARARQRRHHVLAAHLACAARPITILDVGGTVDYWRGLDFDTARVRRLVLINTFAQTAHAPFEAVTGDARDLSRFADEEFDLVFSNSVIGHVGNFEEQMRMAGEVRRVGRRYMLQTPNQGFPIDWRTLVPGFHWLPGGAQAWFFRRFAVGRYSRARSDEEARHWSTRIRNIRRSEIRSLFPDGRVMNERVLGMTKSFIIHNIPQNELPLRL